MTFFGMLPGSVDDVEDRISQEDDFTDLTWRAANGKFDEPDPPEPGRHS